MEDQNLTVDDQRSRASRRRSVLAGRAGFVVLQVLVIGACCVYDRSLSNAYSLPKETLLLRGGVGLAALACFFAGLHRMERRVPTEIVCLLSFLGLACATTLWARVPSAGLDLIRSLLVGIAFWTAGWILVTNESRFASLLRAVVAGSSVVATVGLLQYAHREELLTRPWEVLHGTWAWCSEGLRALCGERLSDLTAPPELTPTPFVGLLSTDAPGAMHGHRNVAAEVVVLGFLASLGLLLRTPFKKPRGPAAWMLAALGCLATCVCAAFVWLAGSRAAWGGACVGSVLLVVFAARAEGRSRIRWRVIGAFLFVVLIGTATLFMADDHLLTKGQGGGPARRVSERLLDLVDFDRGTLQERMTLWANTWEMVKSAPWGGVGAGNWKVEYPRFARAARVHENLTLRRQPDRAHSDPLQLLAETGVIGFLLMAGFFAKGLMRFGGPRPEVTVSARRAGMVMVVCALLISSAGFSFQEPGPMVFVSVLLGAAAGISPSGRWWVTPGIWRWAFVGFAVLLVVGHFHMEGRIKADRLTRRSQGTLHAAVVGAQDRSAVELSNRQIALRALSDADAAVSEAPATFQPALHRAQVLSRLGLSDDALASVRWGLRSRPDLPALRHLEGQLLLLQGNAPGAYRAVREALEVVPDAPELRVVLGRVLEELAALASDTAGRLQALALAQGQYEVAVRAEDYQPEAHLALARLQLDGQGDVNLAVIHLEHAARNAALQAPLMARVARLAEHERLALGSGYGRRGVKTLALWQSALGLSGGSLLDARLRVAAFPLLRAQEDPAERCSSAEMENLRGVVSDVLTQDPGNLEAWYFRAIMHEKLEEWDEALQSWARIVQAGRVQGFRSMRLRKLLDEAVLSEERIRARMMSGLGEGPPPGTGREER